MAATGMSGNIESKIPHMLQYFQRTVEEGVGEVRLVGELHQQKRWLVWEREQGLGLGAVSQTRCALRS